MIPMTTFVSMCAWYHSSRHRFYNLHHYLALKLILFEIHFVYGARNKKYRAMPERSNNRDMISIDDLL